MKKLLSICFLSILLGLMSFSVKAQGDNNSCKSGFWIENLQPETVTGIVNLPPEGTLDLSHTLGSSVYNEATGMVLGNAHPGVSELYELHFCNTCGLDPKTRLSIDWLLYRDGQLVNGNLSDYADFEIYTEYKRLNNQGECQSIHWLGGKVNDASGYCNQMVAPDMFSGIPCSDKMNYPGAMQAEQGFPYSVFENGNIHPAQGFVNVYSENLNYFNLDFFDQARTIVRITWKQMGNYSLVMRVRQMVGGTEFNNLYWNENQATDFVGGHQACCGPIIAEDSIHGLVKYDTLVEVCEDENAVNPFVYGNPEYVFSNDKGSMPDTNVVWMHNEGEGECAYEEVDSLARLHFFIRVNPDLKSVQHEVCRCEPFTSEDLVALLDTIKSEGMVSATFWWKVGNTWTTTVPTPATEVGTYTYIVRQTTHYQTIDCTGDEATITFTVNPIPAPVVKASATEFCNEQTYANPVLTATIDDPNKCSTMITWYYKDGTIWKSAGAAGNSLTVNLADYKPTTNVDKSVTFRAYAVGYDRCDSTASNDIVITFHQTPEIKITAPETVCAGATDFDWTVEVTSKQTDRPYVMTNIKDWNGTQDDITLNNTAKTFAMNSTIDPYFVCGEEYKTTFRVMDDNGCYVDSSVTVTAEDTQAPVVNPAAVTTYINACEINEQTAPAVVFYKGMTGADFKLSKVTDNCFINWTKTTYKDTVIAVSDTTCEAVTIRTYTFYDYCDNTATLTQTIIAHDSVKPYFDFSTTLNGMPYVRLYPVPAGNCTYDAPDSLEFVNAVKAFVKDNCTDPDYLISTIRFFWENTNISPIGEKNIFRVHNHLTVSAQIFDRCGNDTTQMVIYLDRPDTLSITPVHVALDPICQDATTTISFDTTLINDDTIVGPFLPYSYQWSEVNGREVVFGDANAKETTIAPVGYGDFVFVMTVTNGNGCVATSAPYSLHVNPTPNVAIYKDVRNGATEPYCPTYGNLTVYAADATTGAKLNGLTYVWSGESVNEASTIDTTWVTIVPELCKHDYPIHVVATDEIGCFAEADIIIKVEDTEGLVFTGELNDSTVIINEGCKMYVPDFQGFFTSNTVTSTCWNWSDIIAVKDAQGNPIWYSQSPKAGEIMTQNTVVTITLTAPCNDKTTTYTVNALVPEDFLQVNITVEGDSVCENDPGYNGIVLNADAINGATPYAYQWSRENEEISGVAAAEATYVAHDMTENNQNTQINYQVLVTDALGCKATADATITVLYKGTLPDTTTYPNTLCVGHNGSLVLFGVIRNYTYIFQDQVKVHDVPEHQVTPSNTMVFDNCYAGEDMPLVIITPDGCEQTMFIDIANDNEDKPAKPVVAKVDVTNCSNDNGSLTVTMEAGYTYYFVTPSNDETGAVVYDTTLLTNPNIINLGVGTYGFYRVNNVTGCVSDLQLVTLEDKAPRPLVPNANLTPNTLCENEEGLVNGAITITNTTLYHIVYTNAENDYDTLYKGYGAYTINNLAAGNYYVTVVDPETGCASVQPRTFEIINKLTLPVINVTTANNQYCYDTIANGKIVVTITKATNYEYTITNGDEVIPSSQYSSLYAGTYTINAVNTDTYCQAVPKTVTIVDETTDPVFTLTSSMNNNCDPAKFDGKITVNVTNTNKVGTNNTYVLVYNGLDEEEVVAEQTNNVFTGLNGGNYTVQVISQYGCSSVKDIEVAQYQAPALVMTSSPNTMCVSTFEKPGNGTITITAPVSTADGKHFYHYNYYYALNPEMDVPYHDPLTMTKYWLATDLYHVIALDTVTGCKAEGDIAVGYKAFNVTPVFATTDNTNCEGAYNGTITVTEVVSDNIDAIWKYGMDGVNFTNNNVFTGLKDSAYIVYVQDVNTGCIYNGTATINNGDECAPVITVTDTKGNTGTEFHYCVGEVVDLVATASAAEGCAEGEYDYNWFVDCHSRTSNTNTIDVLTDEAPFCCHYVVTAKSHATGCSQTQEITVCIEKNPEVIFTVNDEPIEGNTAEICQNEDVKIGILKSYTENGYTTNIESCIWTNAFHSTSFDTTFAANSLQPDSSYSFCVDVVSEYGCTNRAIFTLKVNASPYVTIYDTVCTSYEFNLEGAVQVRYNEAGELVNIEPAIPDSHWEMSFDGEYVYTPHIFDANGYQYYDQSQLDSIAYPLLLKYQTVNGCDSIVNHHVTFLGLPKIEFNTTDTVVVCPGTTVAEVLAKANLNISNAGDTTYLLNGESVQLTDPIEFVNNNNLLNNITIVGTAGPKGNKYACESTKTLAFYLIGEPEFVNVGFEPTEYCAGDNMLFHNDITFNYPHRASGDVVVSLIFRDTTNGTVVETVVDENVNLPEYEASTTNYFVNTAYTKYDQHNGYFILKVDNGCDVKYSDPYYIRVDSSVVTIEQNEFCINEVVDIAAICGNPEGFNFDNANLVFINETPQGQSNEIRSNGDVIGYNFTGWKMTVTNISYDGPCKTVKSDTVNVTVKLLPSINVTAQFPESVCYEDENIIPSFTFSNYTSAKFVVKGVKRENIANTFGEYADVVSTDSTVIPVFNVTTDLLNQVVDAMANYFVAEVILYAENECGQVSESFGKTRVVKTVDITSGNEAVICNEATVIDAVKAANTEYAWNNVIANVNDSLFNDRVQYTIVRNGEIVSYVEAAGAVLTQIGAQDGDSLMIITMTDACDYKDTAFVKLNIATITFNEPELKAACAGSALSEFIDVAPEFTGKATVTEEGWYIATTPDMTDAVAIEETEVITKENIGDYVAYVWKTTCKDSVSTTPMALEINVAPAVNFTEDILTVCAESSMVPEYTVESEPAAIDTTWAINGNAIEDINTYAYATTDTMLVITVSNECGSTSDTIKVVVNPLPTPEVLGDTIVCANKEVNLIVNNAVATSTYTWYNAADGTEVATVTGTDAAVITSAEGVNKYYVEETDVNGCVGTSENEVTIESSDNPQFIFTYEGAETHVINGIQTSEDQFLNYTWKINQMCLNPDTLVYVNFHFYHNDTLIDNSKLSQYFAIQTQQVPQSQGGGTMDWMGSDQISWINADGTPNQGFTTYYNASTILNTPNTYGGNHFPASTLGTDNGNYYTSFYLHFFNNREVSKVLAPFSIPGEYKIVYELWSTNHHEVFQDLYTNEETNTNKHIGAQGAKSPTTDGYPTILALLATDSLIINVEGETLTKQQAPQAAPQTSPAIYNVNTEDNAPAMEVWPNPATTSTTKLTARVHNMSGDAQVVITEMTGRQIFGDRTTIDSDDFIYECSINNLSQGVYVMTIRTKDGLATKKIVVRR